MWSQILNNYFITMCLANAEVSASSTSVTGPVATRQDVYAGELSDNPRSSMIFVYCVEQLAAIPEFAHLGSLFKSSFQAVELTESETEYVVCCVKHTFQQHIIFQVHKYYFCFIESLHVH